MGLGRLETWARLGRVKTAESMFNDASLAAEDREWRTHLQRNPHGESWHSSFHVSQAPIDDPRACERKLLYGLMGIPPETPASRMLRGTAIVGQAVENWNVANLDLDGRLLSAAVDAEHQTGFVDADHWLTGSPDFVVLPRGWNRPHLIETKTKDCDVVVDMKNLQRSYDAGHARQLRGYIGLGNRITPQVWPSVIICRETWRLAVAGLGEFRCRDHGGERCLMELQLEPLRTGSLIYCGRDRPNVTCEYVFEHDEEMFQRGLSKLVQVQEHFARRSLPPHPFGGKDWSKPPCQYCDFKRSTCKPDHVAGITDLAESNGIAFAEKTYGAYEFVQVMEAVRDRWAGKSGTYANLPQHNLGRGVKAVA